MSKRKLREGAIVNKLAQRRIKAGHSQLWAGKLTGVHFTTVSRHENTGQVPCHMIIQYALAYHVPPICLFFDPEEVHIAA